MVQLFPQRFESPSDIGVIDEPTEFRIAWACHNDFSLKAVSMQPTAFMRSGQMRQQMCRLKLECLSEFNHENVFFSNSRLAPRLGSADLQSAVSQVFNLLAVRSHGRGRIGPRNHSCGCRLQIGDTADCKSALRPRICAIQY